MTECRFQIPLWPLSKDHARGGQFTKREPATLGVRPQYLMPALDGQGMQNGQVLLTERLRSETVVNLAVADGGPLIAAISEDTVLVPGTDLSWSFDTTLAHVCSPNGFRLSCQRIWRKQPRAQRSLRNSGAKCDRGLRGQAGTNPAQREAVEF